MYIIVWQAVLPAANAVGISTEEAVDTLSVFGEEASRQKIVEMPWGFIIDDTYNAGPESHGCVSFRASRYAGGS